MTGGMVAGETPVRLGVEMYTSGDIVLEVKERYTGTGEHAPLSSTALTKNV